MVTITRSNHVTLKKTLNLSLSKCYCHQIETARSSVNDTVRFRLTWKLMMVSLIQDHMTLGKLYNSLSTRAIVTKFGHGHSQRDSNHDLINMNDNEDVIILRSNDFKKAITSIQKRTAITKLEQRKICY